MGEVTVTAAPSAVPVPEFLKAWAADSSTSTVHVFKKLKEGEAPGPYEKVELHNFIFLGRPFQSSGYVGKDAAGKVVSTHSGAGVCAEFKAVLLRAQERIYQEYARQQIARGREPTESGFKDWCNIQGTHIGWQFRGGNHRYGNAIDIDALFNPYIATGTLDPLEVGGEQPESAPQGKDAEALRDLRGNALAAYNRALKFMFGPNHKITSTPFAHAQPGETSAAIAARFAQTSEALAWYMSTAMTPVSGNRLPFARVDNPRTLDEMRERLRQHINFRLGATNPKLKELLTDTAALSSKRDEIFADHEAVRKVMLFGSWRVEKGKIVGAEATRDPCFGFLSLRQEIVVGIREAGTRWGAADFGKGASGDIMHFDTTSKPQVTEDSNENRVRYSRQ